MCISCKKPNIMRVVAKCGDLYCGDHAKGESSYVPSGLGIGGGDYIDFKLCLNCGQIQDKFPKEPTVESEEE